MLPKWSKVINRSDKIMNKDHKVCDLHFKEDDVEKEFVMKLPNGIVEKLVRDRPKLRKGAIPCLLLEKRENPSQTGIRASIPEEGMEKNVENFEDMLTKIKNLSLPSDNWTFQMTVDNIMWIRVIDDDIFSCRRVILGKDLEVKVRFIFNWQKYKYF